MDSLGVSMGFDDSAIVEDPKDVDGSARLGRSSLIKPKTRSLSDGDGTPARLSPSPHILHESRRQSKDDSNLNDPTSITTPRRPDCPPSGLALQLPRRQFTPPVPTAGAFARPAPLSPQLDNSHIYASPTNILPRRSRGLDFSRAATSLHHSTLAESSPDSSPVMGGRAMNIPGRRSEFGGPERSSTSLWSMMGNQERMNLSHSLGSTNAIGSDSSTSEEDEDIMDEDMDDNFITTPSVSKTTSVLAQAPPGAPFGSPAIGSLINFQQRQRPRKVIKSKPRPLGFNSGGSSISNSPPSTAAANARRESISWQANQLHISGMEGDETRASSEADVPNSDGQRNVVRRPVTRRGNLLPKTKTFARIRAALAEEGAPAEAECKREAEVVKQVLDSDVPEPRRPQQGQTPDTPAPATALSSPNQESLDYIPEDDMMGDLVAGLSSSFKQHAMRNSKGKPFWDTFSDTSSIGGAHTTPPPPNGLPRGSSSGMSDDIAMDSPSQSGSSGFPAWNTYARPDSTRSDSDKQVTPQSQPQPPSAAEITRRINNKRRRDDDFDPTAFKRRAVSPGLSVHNSPISQSPLQRDVTSWGSRPGSKGGEKAGSAAPSESGSTSGTAGNNQSANSGNPKGRLGSKGRVGFQGMFDTNDGIMRMSIE